MKHMKRMKKKIVNIVLALIFIAGIAYGAVADGLKFFIGAFAACVSGIALVDINTDCVKYY